MRDEIAREMQTNIYNNNHIYIAILAVESRNKLNSLYVCGVCEDFPLPVARKAGVVEVVWVRAGVKQSVS